MANISNFFSKLLQKMFKSDIDECYESLANNKKLNESERRFNKSVLELDELIKTPFMQKSIAKGEILDPFKTMIYLKNINVEEIKKKSEKTNKSRAAKNKRK